MFFVFRFRPTVAAEQCASHLLVTFAGKKIANASIELKRHQQHFCLPPVGYRDIPAALLNVAAPQTSSATTETTASLYAVVAATYPVTTNGSAPTLKQVREALNTPDLNAVTSKRLITRCVRDTVVHIVCLARETYFSHPVIHFQKGFDIQWCCSSRDRRRQLSSINVPNLTYSFSDCCKHENVFLFSTVQW